MAHCLAKSRRVERRTSGTVATHRWNMLVTSRTLNCQRAIGTRLGTSQTPGFSKKTLRNLKTIAAPIQVHIFIAIHKLKCLPKVNHFREIPGLVVARPFLDNLSAHQNLGFHHTDPISHKLSRSPNSLSALLLSFFSQFIQSLDWRRRSARKARPQEFWTKAANCRDCLHSVPCSVMRSKPLCKPARKDVPPDFSMQELRRLSFSQHNSIKSSCRG